MRERAATENAEDAEVKSSPGHFLRAYCVRTPADHVVAGVHEENWQAEFKRHLDCSSASSVVERQRS